MKAYRTSTLQGQPLIPQSVSPPSDLGHASRTQDQQAKQDIKSRFELLNLKSPRFSIGSFGPSLKQPAPVHSSWLRDPTPPGSPTEDGEGGSNGRFPIPPGGKNSRQRHRGVTICGIPRRWFWAIVGVIVIVIAAVAIGLGVGMAQSRSNPSSAATTISPSTGSPTDLPATATASRTATSTSTATQTSALPSMTGGVDCPAGNGSTYTVPGSTKRFLHLCGVDYSGSEATDVKNVPTDSMTDCMRNCAGTFGCTGCGWGYMEGDSVFEHKCWMKGDLKTSHVADPSWAFAILIQ